MHHWIPIPESYCCWRHALALNTKTVFCRWLSPHHAEQTTLPWSSVPTNSRADETDSSSGHADGCPSISPEFDACADFLRPESSYRHSISTVQLDVDSGLDTA